MSRTSVFKLSLILFAVVAAMPRAYSQVEIRFNRDIRPILSDRCFLCHGPDEAARQAELRLDSFEAATESAIEPGDAAGSELIARISSDDPDEMMPTADSHKPRLTEKQVELFRRWINEGAKYEKHWAYQRPRKVDPPKVDDPRWNEHPIDRFVAARLQAEQLDPSPRADRMTLLRRVALDLTGLPPTAEEIIAYQADVSTDALEHAVDRLLKSPAYGEHMARYWLDAARYADSHGYQYDRQRDQWAWRDWVINSFNQNQPFDQFTIEQLAGDLLPDATDQQRLATGFNRNHPITIEGGVIDEEYRTEYVIDRVVTTGTVWMGATLICSRCHDHKFDPTTQKEFYQLFDFFNHVPEKGHSGFAPLEKIVSPFQQSAITQADGEAKLAEERFSQAITRWNPDRDAFENEIKRVRETVWSTPKPDSMKTQGASELELREHGEILAVKEAPANDVYEIEYEIGGQTIGVLKLEALTDESLPHQGAGRSFNANFVLSEITVETTEAGTVTNEAGDAKYQSVEIRSATADYSQPNYPIAAAIDGKIDPNSGWAVSGNEPAKRVDRTATFVLAEPLETEQPRRLRIRLHFASRYAQHAIGKLRISFADEPQDVPQGDVAAALAIDKDKRSAAQMSVIDRYMVTKIGPLDVKQLAKELADRNAELKSLRDSIPNTMIMTDLPKPRKSYLLERGEYDKKTDEVSAAVPSYLPPLPSGAPNNRLGLAQWLVAPENPLTARVTVNRFWQQLFGIGLVDTPEDFGLQGSAATHPDLLDFLAVDFVDSGWDVKRLLRMIVTSQTYQQSSAVTADAYARDPDNRLLARGPRVRLAAETIRDSALTVSGLLNRTIGGPSSFPYHPKGLWLEVNNRPGYSTAYAQQHGENLYRRSMYTFWKRTVPPPSMSVFDAPNREYCLVRRSRTNTPLQAFVMLHDPQFVEAARKLAERMLVEGGETIDSQIGHGFLLALGRSPMSEELELLRESFEEERESFRRRSDQAKQVFFIGESERNKSLAEDELAGMISVARLIMNLSEFVTKE